MNRSRLEKWSFRLLILLLAALPAAYLAAQSGSAVSSSDGVQVRLSGTIQAGSSAGVIINGVLIDTRAISDFTVPPQGAVVRITGLLQPDGTVQAESLEMIEGGTLPGIVELRGTLLTEPTPGTPLALQIGGTFTLIDATGAQSAGELRRGEQVLVYAEQITDPLVAWRALAILPLRAVPEPAATPDVIAPAATLPVIAPIATLEVAAPVSTPEVGDDDRGRGRGRGGDNNDNESDDD